LYVLIALSVAFDAYRASRTASVWSAKRRLPSHCLRR